MIDWSGQLWEWLAGQDCYWNDWLAKAGEAMIGWPRQLRL